MAKQRKKAIYKLYLSTPRQGLGILLATILLSLLFHVVGYISTSELTRYADRVPPKTPPVKIRIAPKQDKLAKKKQDEKDKASKDDELKKIFETKLTPTQEKPKDAKHAGAQDHKAEKEMRVATQPNRQRGLDPGEGGADTKSQQKQPLKTPPREKAQAEKQQQPQKKPVQPVKPHDKIVALPKQPVGRMSIGTGSVAPRNKYEELMPTSQELADMRSRGYQEHVDEAIALGDRVDINTSNYRYIGYFSSMRKAIELVWNYPYEAIRRGLQGEVDLEFTINKDGSTKNIKVLRSSGYPVLDKAIVDAIKMASPFAPLPDGFGKEKLVITGSFHYVLTNYAGN